MMQETTRRQRQPEASLLQAAFEIQDRCGFAAGDVSLHRYVGNNPTNMTDPSGLKKREPFDHGFRFGEVGPSRENITLREAERNLRAVLPIYSKEWLRKHLTGEATAAPLPPAGVAYVRDGLKNSGTNILGGKHAFFGKPKPGQYFGTGGCETCIGVIMWCPNNSYGAVFHLDTGDAAGRSLFQYEWPKGGTVQAILCGGNDTFASRNLLASVGEELKQHFVKVLGLVDKDNVYIGLAPGGDKVEFYVR
jgi:hypothetical protein